MSSDVSAGFIRLWMQGGVILGEGDISGWGDPGAKLSRRADSGGRRGGNKEKREIEGEQKWPPFPSLNQIKFPLSHII